MPSDAYVREHVNRILASAGFQGSERLSRFLRFAVEAKLRGEGGQIKEYLIGREVFDRDEDYDPRLDPIVRVEARRLRRKLDEYYASSPAEAGGLRIEFPKGSYAPEFQVAPSAPRRESKRFVPAVLGAAVVAAALLGMWAWRARQPEPLIAVLPAHWFWRTDEFSAGSREATYDEELAELTAAELAGRRAGSVAAWPLLQQYRGRNRNIREITADVHARRALMVAVRPESGGYRVTAYLMDPDSGGKLGVYDASSQRLGTMEERRRVAGELANAVAAMR
jgi:hypothetical protein